MTPDISNEVEVEVEAALVRRALQALVASVHPRTLKCCVDKGITEILDSVGARNQSDEGTLWAIDHDAEALVPIYHRGPDPDEFLSGVSQPLGDGIISMVFAGGTGLCENDIAANPSHSRRIDQITGRETAAMIVTPTYAAGSVIAVLTGVKIRPDGGGDPGRYSLDDLSALQSSARIVGELIEHRLLVELCGWNDV